MGQRQSSCQPSLLPVCTLGSATQCYLNLTKGVGGGGRAALQDVSPVRPRDLPQTEGGPLLLHLLSSCRSLLSLGLLLEGFFNLPLSLLCCSVLNMSQGELLWGCASNSLCSFPKEWWPSLPLGGLTGPSAHGWTRETGGQEVVETDPRSQ